MIEWDIGPAAEDWSLPASGRRAIIWYRMLGDQRFFERKITAPRALQFTSMGQEAIPISSNEMRKIHRGGEGSSSQSAAGRKVNVSQSRREQPVREPGKPGKAPKEPKEKAKHPILRFIGRTIATLLCLALVAGLFAACSGSKDNNAKADSKKVGIAVLSENGAFTDMRTGIESKLKEKYGDNVTCVYKNAAGDAASLSTIVSDFDNGDYDAVFTIATPATQAFVNQESETPCFFCAVSDPVAAKVMTALDTPDKNATGTSNAIPVSEIIDMGYKLTPDVKKWGFIYSTSQVNATSTVKAAEKYLDSKKIAYAEKTVENSADVKSVTQSLIDGGCDVIFVPNDSVVQDGVSALTELCQEKKIPTYCSSATTVASGCTATLAIDDKGIGEKTAEMAIQYFDGKKVAEIPAQVCGIDYCSVNKTALAAGGLATPTKDTVGYEVKVLEAAK